MKLVVIGSANMDMVINVPRIPAVGETILGRDYQTIFGGKGANQAIAAKRAGGDIVYIGKVGNDDIGKEMVQYFQKEGLSRDHILIDELAPTGIAQIWVSDKGQNSIVVAPGANMSLHPKDIDQLENLIAESEIVLLQLETPIATIAHIIELAQSHNTKVILNPAPAQKLSDDLYTHLWILTPNESEANFLTGIEVIDIPSAKLASRALRAKGVSQVIITLGALGSVLCNDEGEHHFTAYETTAIDSTAAGDTFNGCLAVALTEGQSISKAIQFASAAAAIAVSRHGAQTSTPYREEIDAFIQRH